MEQLNGQSFAEVLSACDEYPGLQVGIACSNGRSVQNFITAIRAEIMVGRLKGWRYSHSRNNAILERAGNGFCDKSYIHIFDARDTQMCQGLSFHKVLFEDGISNEVLDALLTCERLMVSCVGSGEMEDNGKEIDEFLKGFKIIERSKAK